MGLFSRGSNGPWRSKLRPTDVLGTGTVGIRTRKARATLTAMGIAIGIASMVSVMGISASSKADLLAELDQLGTNLLQVRSGNSFSGDSVVLSSDAPRMIRRIGPVQAASSIGSIEGRVQPNDLVTRQNGVDLFASESNLTETLGAQVRVGRDHDSASVKLPTVVLGSIAAERLGITDLSNGPRIFIKGQWFDVIGILKPLKLNPEIDRGALIGFESARTTFGLDKAPAPTSIYVRTAPERVEAVRSVLARTASPGSPNEVKVSRPSDALAARAEVDKNLQNLLLGLGGVALLVGGVGIANVMVISVLERRGEIGVRRALGATRSHIRNQFVVESTLLSLIGGVLGVSIGFGVTTIYAQRQGWLVSLPIQGLVGGVLAALLIGALAGLYPAARAARLDPAEAVRPAA